MPPIIRVYNPTAESGIEERTLAPRLTSLEQQVVGFLNNGKLNGDRFIERVALRLKERYGIRSHEVERKPSTSMPAPPRMIQKLATECAAVISVWGD
ncbi:MAG: hypothetical protein KGJ86_02085 [Chloroflexota bacterium]|nr:hypothetical protein [Chloroflexota bacterium]